MKNFMIMVMMVMLVIGGFSGYKMYQSNRSLQEKVTNLQKELDSTEAEAEEYRLHSEDESEKKDRQIFYMQNGMDYNVSVKYHGKEYTYYRTGSDTIFNCRGGVSVSSLE